MRVSTASQLHKRDRKTGRTALHNSHIFYSTQILVAFEHGNEIKSIHKMQYICSSIMEIEWFSFKRLAD